MGKLAPGDHVESLLDGKMRRFPQGFLDGSKHQRRAFGQMIRQGARPRHELGSGNDLVDDAPVLCLHCVKRRPVKSISMAT